MVLISRTLAEIRGNILLFLITLVIFCKDVNNPSFGADYFLGSPHPIVSLSPPHCPFSNTLQLSD